MIQVTNYTINISFEVLTNLRVFGRNVSTGGGLVMSRYRYRYASISIYRIKISISHNIDIASLCDIHIASISISHSNIDIAYRISHNVDIAYRIISISVSYNIDIAFVR
jgi:hypothetical protein